MSPNASLVIGKKHSAGMTLLEVLVALFIFALTGTAIMKAASDHLTGVGQIEDITFATWVANNRLNQVHIDNTWPIKNNKKGEQEMAGRLWYWQQRTIKTSDDEMVQVEITVGLDEQYQESITSVSTFIAKQI
ncbi:type II secretion system minor pseudopilin GspI [Paraglaciecola arctica]|uniref:type II secretion system minor pseudopilin GspI n=1 Tax=Paraglaciecola arctica TaxID=1128911 RepID=UPI001C07997B|nr:type II secretion system minor pseudopilin GspI [Paraglaciecola arctica]MBU3005855.1 type II secretion system minor pseudopilin GspI [Paraglaciecola arctica]